MGHHHHHHDSPGSGSALGLAFFLNFIFALIEFVGGYLTNSVAILSDAVHDLGDSVALALTWYFEKVSFKQRDARYTYGYRRFSVLAALISSVVLLVGSTLILKEAIPRLWQAPEVFTPGMMGLACLGILVNGLAFFRLHPQSSPGEKAVRLHLLEDVLGWVAVLLGSVIIYFTHWFWIDPLLSIGVACFILWNVVKNLHSFSRIILQAVPDEVDLQGLTLALKQVEGVQSVHDFHLWTMDSNRHVLSLHIVVSNQTLMSEVLTIKQQAKQLIREYGIEHDTLELELVDENCSLETC